MTLFEKYYKKYMSSIDGFDKFHNEVINMPRDQFSDAGLNKVRTLAGYLLLTEGSIPVDGVNYKDIIRIIHNKINNGQIPLYRDVDLERRYFTYTNLNRHYDAEGRMFRHLMCLSAFFGFIKSLSRQKKIIVFEKCREYYLSSDAILIPIARNNLVSLNAKDNEFINSLIGVTITNDTDYRPTYAILQYINRIGRPVTKFELSVLLGRIDDLKKEKDILKRAIEIGNILPNTASSQKYFFFSNMKWKNQNGTFFEYSNSQQPQFKFNSYLLYLEQFGLIDYNNVSESYTLTDYATKIINDDISYLIADLEELLKIVDDYSNNNGDLNDLILSQRNPELLELAKKDSNFIQKMNFRSLNNPIFDCEGRRKRNKLISELAKILASYKCQYCQRHIFKMPNGKYYCEAHHILEFNSENGPDITDNLVVLGPEAHMIAHHACQEERDDLYLQLIRNDVLKFEQFKQMIVTYNCLNRTHVELLFQKKIITNREKAELLELLATT